MIAINREPLDVEREYLDLKSFCKFVPGGCGLATVWRWMTHGVETRNGRVILPSTRFGGGKRLIARSDAIAFLRTIADSRGRPGKSGATGNRDEDRVEAELAALTA